MDTDNENKINYSTRDNNNDDGLYSDNAKIIHNDNDNCCNIKNIIHNLNYGRYSDNNNIDIHQNFISELYQNLCCCCIFSFFFPSE